MNVDIIFPMIICKVYISILISTSQAFYSRQGGYVFGSVSVCLSVCKHNSWKHFE